MAVAVAAFAALGLGALVSRLIKRHSGDANVEAGPGDDLGTPDRGPDGQRM